MRHSEVLIVPVLMLADYYLTIVGAKLAQSGYRAHFKSASYELNPIWRGDVAKLRWFNPRHLLLAALLTALLLFAAEASDTLDPWFFPVMFGMVLGAFTPIITQHLGNILTFEFMRRNPNEVEGSVTFSMRYAIVASIAQGMTVLVVLALVAWLTQVPIAYGMLAGAGVLMLARFSWFARAKRGAR